MRSPIDDKNAGAPTDVAPTVKHAQRAATVAKNHSQGALQKQQRINAMSSELGGALGGFMEKKLENKNKQRYMEAYHAQGFKEGLSEFQKDSKKTGFAELIYGGQTPEYKGALAAATKNAANSMYIEEADYIEREGGNISPKDYAERISAKVTEYNLEHFSDSPGAAVSFLENWKENSNLLSKQHVKLYKVRELERARQEVAEGWQVELDTYKAMMLAGDHKAAEHLAGKMMDPAGAPVDMDKGTWTRAIRDEAINAAMAHDYTSLKLLQDSGLHKNLDPTVQKQYEAAVKVLDTDNERYLTAARYDLDAAVRAGSWSEVNAARRQLDTVRAQAAGRDTGSSQHMLQLHNSDRWRTEYAKEYSERLKKEHKERIAEQVADVNQAESTRVHETALQMAPSEERREIMAKYLDELAATLQLNNKLPAEVRMQLERKFKANKKLLNQWTSAAEKEADDRATQDAEQAIEKRMMSETIESLKNGNGAAHPEVKKEAVETILRDTVFGLLGPVGQDLSETEALESVLNNPKLSATLFGSTEGLSEEIASSKMMQNAVKNSANMLNMTNPDNKYTPEQVKRAQFLLALKDVQPALFKSAFPTSISRGEIVSRSISATNGEGILETNKKLSSLRSAPETIGSGENFDTVMTALNLTNEPDFVQDLAWHEYRGQVGYGHDLAVSNTKMHMSNINPKLSGFTVQYGGTFGDVDGYTLKDIMETYSKPLMGVGTQITGWSPHLAELMKNEETKFGIDLHKPSMNSNIRMFIHNGQLTLSLPRGATVSIPRDQMSRTMKAYEQAARERKQYAVQADKARIKQTLNSSHGAGRSQSR